MRDAVIVIQMVGMADTQVEDPGRVSQIVTVPLLLF